MKPKVLIRLVLRFCGDSDVEYHKLEKGVFDLTSITETLVEKRGDIRVLQLTSRYLTTLDTDEFLRDLRSKFQNPES